MPETVTADYVVLRTEDFLELVQAFGDAHGGVLDEMPQPVMLLAAPEWSADASDEDRISLAYGLHVLTRERRMLELPDPPSGP